MGEMNQMSEDPLRIEQREQQKRAHDLILTSARLVAPILEKNAADGFAVVATMLSNAGMITLANEVSVFMLFGIVAIF